MTAAYISYPFCRQKCTFCNFASGVAGNDARARYERALVAQVSSYPWTEPPSTLYFGGGTPSLISADAFEQIFRAVPGGGLKEVTMECAPGTLCADTVARWAESGVNRLSFGVQSFVPEELRRVGRTHDASTVANDLVLVRRYGLTNINLDLIAGLPGQTRDTWRQSLACLTGAAPQHVSIYLFEIDEDSRLGSEALRGGDACSAPLLPSADLVAEFYEMAVDRLRAAGYHRYEFSNFAKPGFESQHNLVYWRLEPYVGFGADAHSFDGRLRWATTNSVREFCDDVEAGRSPVRETALADREQERFFIGLRLAEGVPVESHEWSRFSDRVHDALTEGLLERVGDHLRFTDAGVLVSNEVLQEFI